MKAFAPAAIRTYLPEVSAGIAAKANAKCHRASCHSNPKNHNFRLLWIEHASPRGVHSKDRLVNYGLYLGESGLARTTGRCSEKQGPLILHRAGFTRSTRRFCHPRIRIINALQCHLIHSSFNGCGAHTRRPSALALREFFEANVPRRESL